MFLGGGILAESDSSGIDVKRGEITEIVLGECGDCFFDVDTGEIWQATGEVEFGRCLKPLWMGRIGRGR